MQLKVAVSARRDLDEIHGYGIGTYGPSAADAYLAELFEKFEHIARWPYAVQERRARRSVVRLSRMRAHNIMYSVKQETVAILRVFHHSVNWIDLL